MYQRLRELGIPAVLTRADDTTLTRDERINTMINSFGNGEDVLILSNHINAGGGQGGEVYYPLRDDGELARGILQEWENIGRTTRGAFQRTLPEDPSKDYYYIQRLTPDTTSLLIEYGYIDNPNDARLLQTDLLNYVEAVIRAVANYANVPYSPPGIGAGPNTYTVQPGDKIFMGNNEVYKESLKEVLLKCKIIFYLSAIIALKMFTYYYRNDIIVV